MCRNKENKQPGISLPSSHSWKTVLPSQGGCSRSSAKASAVWFVELSCATVSKSLKEVVTDPTWVQPWSHDSIVVSVHTVNNSNNIW